MIKFTNIRSNETLVADSEQKIAALWASSDRGPNASKGQDFGWRLSPKDKVELERITQDRDTLETIALKLKKEVEELQEYDILMWMAARNAKIKVDIQDTAEYEDEYNREIQKLRKKQDKPVKE